MTWIETIAPENATGDLRQLYESIRSARGGVAEIDRALSLHPRALAANFELYKAVMFARSSLTRIERERIGVVVSHANHCVYCVKHHGETLRQLGDDRALVRELTAGRVPRELTRRERALLDWARTAALAPSGSSADAIEQLRSFDYDDRAILDAALAVSFFSFLNRLVLILGLTVEPDFERTCGDMGA